MMTSAATVWHSSYSPVAEQIMASDQDRKQFLEMYAKMNPSDAAAEEMNNKLKWDIIRKYHEPISKLTQVKTGKYAGQWHTYMKGVDGTAPRQYKRFKTFDDAYQFIVSYYSVQSLTLESYFPHWLEWKCRYHNNKAATKEHNQNAFKKFLLGTKLARIPITQITTDDIDEWCREVLIEYPLNASRFNTYRIVVKGPLELACKENLISTNPWQSERMDYKQFLKSKRRAPSGKKIFYDDEIRQIVNNCLESYAINRNSANIAVIVNFDLGLRVSELSALKWSDIDWKNNTVFIQRQESMRVVEDYVKSDSAGGYRELPLSSQRPPQDLCFHPEAAHLCPGRKERGYSLRRDQKDPLSEKNCRNQDREQHGDRSRQGLARSHRYTDHAQVCVFHRNCRVDEKIR